MNIEFNEEVYARFKALQLTDAEMCYLLNTTVNKLSYYKAHMDYAELSERTCDNLEKKSVQRFHERMTRKYHEKQYNFKRGY